MNAREITKAKGGDWHGSYGLVPGPGHSPHDRSVKVTDGDHDVIVHSFAGDDWREIKDAWRRDGFLSGPSSGEGGGSLGSSKTRSTRATNRETAKRQVAAQPSTILASIWQNVLPIGPNSFAHDYLAGRGCCDPHPEGDLQWHPNLEHRPTRSHWPALVGLITDAVTGQAMSVHLTYLDRDGSGKAPIKPTRLYLAAHPKAGGVVRLWPDSEVTGGLAIGEGLETCLTAARAFTPVWAALDAGNLGAFPVLGGIEALTIIADHEVAGLRAAEQCAERWAAASRQARIWCTEAAGRDLNDWAAA